MIIKEDHIFENACKGCSVTSQINAHIPGMYTYRQTDLHTLTYRQSCNVTYIQIHICTDMHAYIHTCRLPSTYSFIPTILYSYVQTVIDTYRHAHLQKYLFICVFTDFHIYIHACVCRNSHPYGETCVHIYVHRKIQSFYILTYPYLCMITYIPAHIYTVAHIEDIHEYILHAYPHTYILKYIQPNLYQNIKSWKCKPYISLLLPYLGDLFMGMDVKHPEIYMQIAS